MGMKYRLVPEDDIYQQPTEPPEPKWRFRWAAFVGVPLSIAAILFLLNGINPSFQIEDLMNRLGIANQNFCLCSRMLCLMVVCIAIILIVKLFKNKPEE